MTINVGIVGSGQVARFHVKALERTDTRIVGIADVNEAAGGHLASRTGAKYFSSYDKLLEDPGVQVVVVATPNHLHYEMAASALDAGKDVFCEKPMTTRREHSVDLVERVRQHPDQIFQVGYMKRCNSGFRLVKELLPRIGPVVTAHIRVLISYRGVTGSSWYQRPSQSGGGILTHSGSHLLDVVHWLLGDPVRVDSRVRYEPTLDGLDWLSLTLMDLENGPTIYFSTVGVPIAKVGHTQQGWEETIEIIGTKGRIHLSSPNWEGTMPPIVKLQLDEEDQIRTIFPDNISQSEVQMQAFLRSVETRRQTHPDVVDGYRVDEVLACIYESGEKRLPLDVLWRY